MVVSDIFENEEHKDNPTDFLLILNSLKINTILFAESKLKNTDCSLIGFYLLLHYKINNLNQNV
jgi:hypothetical protein